MYVDAEGSAVSPLYTWEDERGNRFVTDTDKENGTDFGRKAVDQETNKLIYFYFLTYNF